MIESHRDEVIRIHEADCDLSTEAIADRVGIGPFAVKTILTRHYAGVEGEDVNEDRMFGVDGAEQTIRIVARRYGLDPKILAAKTRKREVVHARHIAMFLCCEYTCLGLKAIGRLFNRDHSSVIHARDKVSMWAEMYPDFTAELESAKRAVL